MKPRIHGTRLSYQRGGPDGRGCRCAECKRSNAESSRSYKAKKQDGSWRGQYNARWRGSGRRVSTREKPKQADYMCSTCGLKFAILDPLGNPANSLHCSTRCARQAYGTLGETISPDKMLTELERFERRKEALPA